MLDFSVNDGDSEDTIDSRQSDLMDLVDLAGGTTHLVR